MSFYSYKNANSGTCPGAVSGSVTNGLCQRLCIQVKNVYDACLSQTQLDDESIEVCNIVPVLPGCGNTYAPCRCDDDNRCTCVNNCDDVITHQEAVENLENRPGAGGGRPVGNWTFESCRSSTTHGEITNLVIDRLCDRPQYARVRCTVDVPIDVMFTDQRCREWIGQSHVQVDKDVILCIPEESIVPFTVESLVSAICVNGEWTGGNGFDITICMTVVLKVLAEVEVMIPTYGFCEIPPCEEFAETVCDEFFSLPLFPQNMGCLSDANAVCPSGNDAGNDTPGSARRTCSRCGTVCANGGSTCPRCGCAMTRS